MQNQNWRTLVEQGNHCYLDGQLDDANGYYLEAYDLLNNAINALPNCLETLMAWIAICHNIAAVHESQTDLSQALIYLQLPYEYCQQHMQQHPDQELGLIALKCLNLSWSAILLFGKKHPEFMQNQSLIADLAHAIDPSCVQYH